MIEKSFFFFHFYTDILYSIRNSIHPIMQTIAVLGSGGVGKSCLTLRFITNKFVEEYDATIEDSYRKTLIVDDVPEVLEILDTAGQEEFYSLIDGWIRPAHAVVLVFDVTSRQTFEELERFYHRVVQTKDTASFPMVLVANKCDVPEDRRVISSEMGRRLAREWGCAFVETSAKQRIGCEEVFIEAVRQIRRIQGHRPVTKKRDWCAIL